jgi:hypothetical protein
MALELTNGEGRTRLSLEASYMGQDLVVRIFNEGAHIGAIAIGEYDFQSSRVSVSVLTRLGHKDDAVAQQAAYSIGHSTRRPVCVIAGIHLDNITAGEIQQFVDNSAELVKMLIKRMAGV